MHGHKWSQPHSQEKVTIPSYCCMLFYNDALGYNVAVVLVGSLVIPGILVNCFTLQCPQL